MLLPGGVLLSQTSFADLSLNPTYARYSGSSSLDFALRAHIDKVRLVVDIAAQLCRQTMPHPTNHEGSARLRCNHKAQNSCRQRACATESG
jgi:hypothetical protein